MSRISPVLAVLLVATSTLAFAVGARAAPPATPTASSERPSSALPEACRAAPARGPCTAAFEAYWFDAAAGVCKPFLWGGCGTRPPFDDREACERTCRPH